MEWTIKIKKVELLRTHGTDLINITLDEKSAFPIMNYDTVMKIECQQGFGEEYCKNILKVTPKIIDVR
jgi:hypothetical protein